MADNASTKRAVKRLVQNAEWVLQFLEQYSPYFHDGMSMEVDLGEGLRELQEAVDEVKVLEAGVGRGIVP